jgi:hypothetical protein
VFVHPRLVGDDFDGIPNCIGRRIDVQRHQLIDGSISFDSARRDGRGWSIRPSGFLIASRESSGKKGRSDYHTDFHDSLPSRLSGRPEATSLHRDVIDGRHRMIAG